MPLGSPFVGREAELDQVAAVLAAGRGVVLAGDAGVGKTRLLVEAVERSTSPAMRVLQVRATRSSGVVPLGAFAALVPVDDTAASLARARDAILARAPAVLAIDDAHALDEPSAALTHQLVSQDGVRVVATVRRGEDAPDAIVALWKDGLAGFAARGLSDLEIAARLSVSRRTVETHLHRIYTKLGISGRGELGPLFSGPGS